MRRFFTWFFTTRHQHDWQWVGYGSAGWHLYRCRECGETEIG